MRCFFFGRVYIPLTDFIPVYLNFAYWLFTHSHRRRRSRAELSLVYFSIHPQPENPGHWKVLGNTNTEEEYKVGGVHWLILTSVRI